MILRNPLATPYYRAPVILARGCVSFATLLWATIVLCFPEALASSPRVAWIASYVPGKALALLPAAQWIGWSLALLAAGQLLWLAMCWPPIKWGAIGYAALTFWWGLIWWGVAFTPPLLPTPLATVSVTLMLSLYAFIANPKVDRNGRI